MLGVVAAGVLLPVRVVSRLFRRLSLANSSLPTRLEASRSLATRPPSRPGDLVRSSHRCARPSGWSMPIYAGARDRHIFKKMAAALLATLVKLKSGVRRLALRSAP